MLTSFLSRQLGYGVGSKIYIYDAGTSNARVAYRDGSSNPQPWTQPFYTDVNGRIPMFWIAGTTAYRARILTANDVQIDDLDNLTAETVVPVFPTVAGYGLSTGDLLHSFDTAEKAGFVKLNGKTLGSLASGADYAADANQGLYIFLYNLITALAVSGGRGASALADFGAAKTLTLPEAKGRAFFGLDTMGGAAANRLTGVAFSSGNSSTPGSTGGEALHVLTIAELASHGHTGTTDAGGGHTPAGTVGAGGGHTPTGTVGPGTPHHHAATAPAPQVILVPATGTPSTINGGNAQTLNTADESAHTHPLAMDAVAPHSDHAFTGTPVAPHPHTFTSNNTGSGTAHNTMPPFILGTWFCKI